MHRLTDRAISTQRTLVAQPSNSADGHPAAHSWTQTELLLSYAHDAVYVAVMSWPSLASYLHHCWAHLTVILVCPANHSTLRVGTKNTAGHFGPAAGRSPITQTHTPTQAQDGRQGHSCAEQAPPAHRCWQQQQQAGREHCSLHAAHT